MLKRPMFFILCLICFLLSSCSSPAKYFRMQKQLKQKSRTVGTLERQLEDSREKETQCAREMEALRTRNKELTTIYHNLSTKIENATLDLEKTNLMIQLQWKVIRLFDDTNKTIETSLRNQFEAKLDEFEEKTGEVTGTLRKEILFSSGSAELTKKDKELLLKLANTVKKDKGQRIVVEGYSDNVPLRLSKSLNIRTNWEMSTARAISVVRFLHEEAGLEPQRLSIVAHGAYCPVAPNDTEEGRRRNRRVEIILVPPR